MTHATCPITSQPLTPPYTISREASHKLMVAADDLPALMDAADYALSGLQRGNERARGRILRDPVNLALLATVSRLQDTLNGYVRALLDHCDPQAGYMPGDWIQASRYIHAHAPSRAYATWEEAPQVTQGILASIQTLEQVASPHPDPTVYAGKCPTCGQDAFAAIGAEATTCACDTTIDVHQARATLIDHMRSIPLTRTLARHVAETITHQPLNDRTLKTWINRGKITPVSIRADGTPLYQADSIIPLLER